MEAIYQVYKEYRDGSFEDWYVGKKDAKGNAVVKVEYHSPSGEGDAHYCDVHFDNGKRRRVFKPDNIDFGDDSDFAEDK